MAEQSKWRITSITKSDPKPTWRITSVGNTAWKIVSIKKDQKWSTEAKVMVFLFIACIAMDVLGLVLGFLTLTDFLSLIGLVVGAVVLIFLFVLGFALWATRKK